MDLKSRLKTIHDFLKPYQSIWQNEIMLLYPDAFRDYPPGSLAELEGISDKADLISLEKKESAGIIHTPKLQAFYQEIQRLTFFPAIAPLPAIAENQETWRSITPKKKHEIKSLAPLIHQHYLKYNIEKIIDIGGGVGLLSQTLTCAYPLRIISLDQDRKLQLAGESRQKKYGKALHNVQFKTIAISEDAPDFLQQLTPQTMSLGLHTCGPLANSQVKGSAQKKISSIINLGCCYHKLHDQDQNLSSYARTYAPLIMNNFTLTLAAQSRKKMNEKDHDFKLMVKRYRYALHFMLVDLYDSRELITFGNSKEKDYSQSFSHYVREQFKRIDKKLLHTSQEIEDYYQRILPVAEKMLKAGIIRDAFGRVLETYLIVDRAIYLEEQGYEVEVLAVFDEEISPRNLGIFAHLANK